MLYPLVALHHTRPSRRTRNGLADLWVAVFLLLIPVVVFWYVWASYAVNVPKWDDHILRYFLDRFDNEPSVSGKIYQVFKQHNEHRIVYDRLITWLDFHLFGTFSYRHLMVVGNLSLLGLLVIFGLALGQSVIPESRVLTRRQPLKLSDCLLYLPPVAFLLLNLSQWENMFWGMAALQNFTVILWVFWTIYLLAFTQHSGAAILMAVAATLTSGNGLLVWPVGFVMLVLQAIRQHQVSRRQLIRWSGGAIAAFIIYFGGYEKPAGNPPARGSFTDLIGGWFAFNGSAVEALPLRPVVGYCVLLGGISLVIVLGICLYILKKWLSRKALSPFDYFFLGTAAFLIGTGAIVAWTRAGFGINTLITSRYKLYSLLLLALLYTYLVSQVQAPAKKWIRWAGVIFSSILMGSSYLTYLGDTIYWRHWLLTHQFNWTHTSNSPAISIDSVSRRYTRLSPAFYDTALSTVFGPAQQSAVNVQVSKSPGGYDIMDTTTPAQDLGDAGAYLLVRSAKRSYLFPVQQNQQSFRNALFQPAHLFTTGFRANIPTGEMDAGMYQLFILTVSDRKATLYPTNQTIESAGPPATTTSKNW